MSKPVAWRYKRHDGQFIFVVQRFTDEQKARGYYREEEGPFFWSDETPLYERPDDQ